MLPPLDLSPGEAIAAKVRSRFSTPVHYVDANPTFQLVVSFGRTTFPLSVDHVGHALRACLGGDLAYLHIVHIRGSVYRFSMASKSVGFLIHNLRSYSCPHFNFHFHLWGFGGPNWNHEYNLWLRKLDQ